MVSISRISKGLCCEIDPGSKHCYYHAYRGIVVAYTDIFSVFILLFCYQASFVSLDISTAYPVHVSVLLPKCPSGIH